MKLIAYTPHGVFEGIEVEHNEEEYTQFSSWLESIAKLEYLSFGTPNGEIYMTKEMINQSIIVLQK